MIINFIPSFHLDTFFICLFVTYWFALFYGLKWTAQSRADAVGLILCFWTSFILLPCGSVLIIRGRREGYRRSQWPRGLRRRSSAARLLRLWVRILPGAWMFICCECCVLSGRGLCDGLITRPEEFYRLWRVVVCDQETSKTRRLKPATGLWKIQPQWVVKPGKQTNNREGFHRARHLKLN